MIVKKDINPERSLYFIGSLVINELKNSSKIMIDFLEIYKVLKQKHNISMNAFTLTLDWLFLNNIVELENGMIKKCF